MAFSKYNKDRPFLVVNLIRMVPKGAPTHKKDYGTTGQWQMGEQISIEDSVKNRHMIEAAVIIDILKAKIVKNRLEESDQEVMAYLVKKYNKEIVEGIQVWMRKNNMNITKQQIDKIEQNIDNPDIISLTLEEGESEDISNRIIKADDKKLDAIKKVVDEVITDELIDQVIAETSKKKRAPRKKKVAEES